MDKHFYDICYSILSYYLHFPDVADTYKDIINGQRYQNNFPLNEFDFQSKKGEIIEYIKKVRINNVIDAYQNQKNPLLFIPVPSGKLLDESTPKELYDNLSAEIPRLICKGIHQIIKHLVPCTDNNALTEELVQGNVATLQKYGLIRV